MEMATACVFLAFIIPGEGRAGVQRGLLDKKHDPQETWTGICVRARHQGQSRVNTDYGGQEEVFIGHLEYQNHPMGKEASKSLNPPLISVSISIDFNAGAILSKC